MSIQELSLIGLLSGIPVFGDSLFSVIVFYRGGWMLMNGIMLRINFRPFELCTHTAASSRGTQ